MENSTEIESQKIRLDVIIENIRKARDQRVQKLLNDSALMTFLEEHYNTVAVSAVKLEFLKRDLQGILNTSLDLAHYSSLIKRMKEANTSIVEVNHPLFLLELNSFFKKNGF
jgi:predicted oxidoreductase